MPKQFELGSLNFYNMLQHNIRFGSDSSTKQETIPEKGARSRSIKGAVAGIGKIYYIKVIVIQVDTWYI